MRSLTFLRVGKRGQSAFCIFKISVVRFREYTIIGRTVYTYVILDDSRGKRSRVDLFY